MSDIENKLGFLEATAEYCKGDRYGDCLDCVDTGGKWPRGAAAHERELVLRGLREAGVTLSELNEVCARRKTGARFVGDEASFWLSDCMSVGQLLSIVREILEQRQKAAA